MEKPCRPPSRLATRQLRFGAVAPRRDGTQARRAGLPPVIRCATWLLALFMIFAMPSRLAFAAAPEGVWLVDGKAAVEIFDCSGLMCGRILWLKDPRNTQGELDRDKNNPDPALQKRRLCGMTIFGGLRSGDRDRWTDGWFYNPDDGETYNISVALESTALVARIYRGVPLFGETKTLFRVSHGVSDGWC
jgi:uncharacterized protein (DUF2147 family)